MEFSDKTIILRVGSFRESDLWLRLLSPGRGVFSAFAFGGGRSRKRFSGCLDLFNEVLFQIKSDRPGNYLSLREGVLLKGPDRLRRDWRRLGVAVNCARFLESFPLTPDGSPKAHSLFADLLNSLERMETLPQFLPIFFRARLTISQGYALTPGHCLHCGKAWEKDEPAVFPLRSSGLLCRTCASSGPFLASAVLDGGPRFSFRPEDLSVLRQVMEQPLPEWKLENYPETAQKNCAEAMDGFLQYHLGLYWERSRLKRG
ncbi:MAG: DNA repair protein RecO [Deltaproteobacteria bacterium]|jgi:DNA repair protein RecO (recombination protein O)|nr:DNA repair protein RecO [Deltaproteobacteria bacterium]